MFYDLYRIIIDISACRDFELLNVKVPLIFSATVGFPPRRVFRHGGRDVSFFVFLQTPSRSSALKNEPPPPRAKDLGSTSS
jgi:hypothetical protein